MICIRLASCIDAPKIVSLVRKSFNSRILNAMIYGCAGITQYLKSQISIPSGLSDTVYVVAESGGVIVGCVELRLLGDTIFLNYICTSRKMRNKGLGKKLLKKAVLIVKCRNHRRMALDVFADNHVAKQWYSKLGFARNYTTGWYSFPVVYKKTGLVGKVSGFPQADLCHARFGFSQFSVHASKNSYSVGRLGNDWFRVTQKEILQDAEAVNTLAKLDARRKILGLFCVSKGQTLPRGADVLCESERMTVDLPILLRAIPG